VSSVPLCSFPGEDLFAGQMVKEGRFTEDAYSLVPPFQEFGDVLLINRLLKELNDSRFGPAWGHCTAACCHSLTILFT